ncbi:MAG: GNAT family N-acetyltransferase [Rhodobacteraceae bacterium]|nr:GNAT family N-acetyltransferase [Paracoccaceae bacterium]
MKPLVFQKGKYRARLTRQVGDIRAAQHLRFRAFVNPDGEGCDEDAFDSTCTQVLIEEADSGTLVGCFRLLALESGKVIPESYSAQFYNLSALENYPGRMVEMGRFCILPGLRDPEILRVAWAVMTRLVDCEGFEMMFGCSSFAGIDAAPYRVAFTQLKQHHIAPKRWRPRQKAKEVVHFAGNYDCQAEKRRAMRVMPPLLRTYLLMGGWVSDHAVVDRGLRTMHVFTGLEVKSVPQGRAQVLRAVARQ